MIYSNWSRIYDASVGDLARETWRLGIIDELTRHGKLSGRVLDVGAGTGIGARLLKALGSYIVTSLDRSSEMLALADAHSDNAVVADASSFELAQRFDAIVLGFDTLNYLTPDMVYEFFQQAEKHLLPSGIIVFDYSSPCLLQTKWKDLSYDQELSVGSLGWRHYWNEDAKLSETTLTLTLDNAIQWEELHVQYGLTAFELMTLAHRAHLSVSSVRNLSGPSFSPESHTHVYVIQRRETE